MRIRLTAVVSVFLAASAASAFTPAGAPDDPMLCYVVKGSSGTPKFTPVPGVSAVDAFAGVGPDVFDLAKPALLCNPADDGTGIVDAATHLESYAIKPVKTEPKHVPQLAVRVVNSLGELVLKTKKPDRLLLPTAIDFAITPPAPNPLLHDVDHYTCYSVKIADGQPKFPKGLQITLGDQFTAPAKIFDIKKPRRLCLPTDYAGGGVKNSKGHYLCYAAKPAKEQLKHVPLTGVKIGNSLGQNEQFDTRKEAEICLPSVVDPECGDNEINQPSEVCDGTDDAACPGLCSRLCACRQQFPFTLDPANSQIEVRGLSALGPGVDRALSLGGLAGTLTLNVDGRLRPGQYEISVPETTLPPLPVSVPGYGVVGTACVFLVEDTTMPGSGLAGTGVLNCFGSPVPGLASPDFLVHTDHCSNGTACDSGTGAACTGSLGNGGKLHSSTGLCVPAAPSDPMCVATDAASGTAAVLEDAPSGDPHDGVCRSPLFGAFGASSWQAGDAILTLSAAIEIRSLGDLCLGPPTTDPNRGPLTTGTAASTIMDVFPGIAPAAGKVQAIAVTGVRFTCDSDPLAPLTGTSGVRLVTSVPALDISLPSPFGLADLNTALILTAQ